MIRTTMIVVAAAVLLGAIGGNAHAADNTCSQRAHAMLTALQAGHYATAGKHFDATMHAKLTPALLEQVWKSMTRKLGPAHAASSATVAHQSGLTVVNIPLGFKGKPLAAQVACNDDHDIAGFHVVPQAKP